VRSDLFLTDISREIIDGLETRNSERAKSVRRQMCIVQILQAASIGLIFLAIGLMVGIVMGIF